MAPDPRTDAAHTAKELEVIRTAADYDYPGVNVGEMLAEIESGCLPATPPDTKI